MSAYTPNLPALITALPDDSTRAPQTEFTRERQVAFLENLSITGSVRSAAAAGGVSHQTAYRARRATPAFRLAWDAALVVARANAEAVLASRAIDGVTEEVRYHGEVVGTRTRYSDRLLLAHLARLDRIAERADAAGLVEDWDEAMARFARGEAPVPEAARPAPVEGREPALRQARCERGLGERGEAAGTPEEKFPGPCNTRSMSPPDRPGAGGPETGWEAWDELAMWGSDEVLAAMALNRPPDAPSLALLGGLDAVLACQREAFMARDEDWWAFGEGYRFATRNAAGAWHFAPGDEGFDSAEGPAPGAS